MKAQFLPTLCFVSLFFLSACGQKGALYLPSKTPKQPDTKTTALNTHSDLTNVTPAPINPN